MKKEKMYYLCPSALRMGVSSNFNSCSRTSFNIGVVILVHKLTTASSRLDIPKKIISFDGFSPGYYYKKSSWIPVKFTLYFFRRSIDGI